MSYRQNSEMWVGAAAVLAGIALILLWARLRLKHSMEEVEKRIERATERARQRFERIAEEMKAEIEQQQVSSLL
ncbi:MAG: hypothetical protein ACOCW2_02270 [Chitinivibrionales bacterium]